MNKAGKQKAPGEAPKWWWPAASRKTQNKTKARRSRKKHPSAKRLGEDDDGAKRNSNSPTPGARVEEATSPPNDDRPGSKGESPHKSETVANTIHSLAATETETAPRRRRGDNLALVATIDGGFHALDTRNGNILWSRDVGGATIRSFQSLEDLDPETGIVIPSVDGTLYVHTRGEDEDGREPSASSNTEEGYLRRFPLTVPEIVHQSPMFQSLPSGRRITIVGSTDSKVFQLDAATGEILATFSTATAECAPPSNPLAGQSQEVVVVSRHDYRVRAFDETTGKELWNFTYSSLKHHRPEEHRHRHSEDEEEGDELEFAPYSTDEAIGILNRVREVFSTHIENMMSSSSSSSPISSSTPVVLSVSGPGVMIDLADPATVWGKHSPLDRVAVERLVLPAEKSVQLYVGPPTTQSRETVPSASSRELVFSTVGNEASWKDGCGGRDTCLVRPGEHLVLPIDRDSLVGSMRPSLFVGNAPRLPYDADPFNHSDSLASPASGANGLWTGIVGSASATFCMLLVYLYYISMRRRRKLSGGGETNAPDSTTTTTTPAESPSQGGKVTIVDDNPQHQRVGKLVVKMDRVKGLGCNGTIVVEGDFDGRAVAVKRMQSALYDRANKEVDLLIQSEGHLNVVRYLAKEETPDFVYLALELCETTLDDALMRESRPETLRALSNATRAFLGEMASALNHLHTNGIVHCDLKPQNVLVVPRYANSNNNNAEGGEQQRLLEFGARWVPKISDMGLSRNVDVEASSIQLSTVLMGGGVHSLAKRQSQGHHHLGGTVGWRAPELVSHGGGASTVAFRARLTRKVDVFALGCIFFYVMEGRAHPFGEDWLAREANVSAGNPVSLARLSEAPGEAIHLISRMIAHDPRRRPTMARVVSHPLLWEAKRRLDFLCDASDEAEGSSRVEDLEHHASEVFGPNGWVCELHTALREDVFRSKHRRYDARSLKDLLRYIRNKKNHREEVENVLTWDPEIFLSRFPFPNLLVSCYVWVTRHASANDVKFGHIVTALRLEAEEAEGEEQEDALLLRPPEPRRKWCFADETKWGASSLSTAATLPPSRFGSNWKTNLCVHFERTHGTNCVAGDKCGFAHGVVELRENVVSFTFDNLDRPVPTASYLAAGRTGGGGSAPVASPGGFATTSPSSAARPGKPPPPQVLRAASAQFVPQHQQQRPPPPPSTPQR